MLRTLIMKIYMKREEKKKKKKQFEKFISVFVKFQISNVQREKKSNKMLKFQGFCYVLRWSMMSMIENNGKITIQAKKKKTKISELDEDKERHKL